jgi:hypothetical protein
MDVSLAFAVQDVPSEALAFSNKAEARFKRGQKLDSTTSRNYRFSDNFDVAAGSSKREQPLVSSWSGVGEAPRL